MIDLQLMKLLLLLLLGISIVTDAKRYECNKELPCGCSSSNVEINERITNGESAVPDSWSMTVSLRYDFPGNFDPLKHECGGTILTESYVLTAASCLRRIRGDVKLANVTIAAGIYKRSQSQQVIREVDEIIIHPNWTSSENGYHHNIALVHLSEPLDIEWNPDITRTCLPSQLNTQEELIQYPAINTSLAVVGWGRTSFESYSDALRQIFVSSLDQKDAKCAGIIDDPKSQFCAGLREGGSGPCNGDFGGPIFQWLTNHWEQVGIASYTSDFCDEKSASAYTRIAYYRDWIDKYIKDNDENTAEPLITIRPIETTPQPYITYQCDDETSPCGCGRRNVRFPNTNNITNHEAIPYSWSMLVSIRLNNMNQHSCSGSILTESYILTSASCIATASLMGITVAAGIHNYSDNEAFVRKVDRISLHPDYIGISDNYANDIAILHMSKPLDIDNNVFFSRTCLAKKYENLLNPFYYPSPGTRLVVVGWGTLNCQNRTNQQLVQQLRVTSVRNEEKNCYVLDEDQDIQFCAGIDQEHTVPCVGDSGSPIFQWRYDYWQQVGIASFIVDHVNFRHLGIYTRIVEYNDWIETIISNCSTTSTSLPTTTATTTVSTTTKSVKPSVVYDCNRTSTCGCGRVPVVLTPTRVVGGENAVAHSWPMMISMRLRDEKRHLCGGTILSNSYILTAAHCLLGYVSNPPQDLTIAVGMTNLLDSKLIRRTVDHIYIHPNYIGRSDGYRHDIAVMHINQSLPTENNLYLTKTCIHRLNPPILNNQYIKNGTRLAIVGWGDLEEDGDETPNDLQQAEVYAIDNEDPTCIGAMNDSELQFCAGLIEGGKDTCQGDSGGPIFQWTGHYWEQLGIVSNGKGCARPGYPGVYTRLSYYYDWINDILKNGTEYIEPPVSSNGASLQPGITATSEISLNNTTTTNETTSKSNAYNHRENIFTTVFLIVLYSMLLQ